MTRRKQKKLLPNTGILKKNTRKLIPPGREIAPHARGVLNVGGRYYHIAGWKADRGYFEVRLELTPAPRKLLINKRIKNAWNNIRSALFMVRERLRRKKVRLGTEKLDEYNRRNIEALIDMV